MGGVTRRGYRGSPGREGLALRARLCQADPELALEVAYQGARLRLLDGVTARSCPQTWEVPLTVGDAATMRPGDVWGRAADAFERWRAGDTVALDDLVGVMTPVLWQVVRAHRLPAEVAEDVVQTTWLTLVRRGGSVQDPAAIGGWLTTTARRESWRVAKASGRALPVEDEELARALPDDESAETAVLRRDGSDRLWAAVDRLTERCRRLLRIVAFEHRPDYARISADLEMPVGSIGPTRARCLDKLRALLVDDPADDPADGPADGRADGRADGPAGGLAGRLAQGELDG